jgi:cytochrome c
MKSGARPGRRSIRLAVAFYGVAAAALLLGQAASTSTPAVQAPSDAVRGKQVFEKRCTGCHALDHDREGPHLAGVYGRTSGTVSGFDYSDAVKSAHIVWSEETLERWLTDPQIMVPGAEMDFFVKDPQERVDVIAFLKQQSGK